MNRTPSGNAHTDHPDRLQHFHELDHDDQVVAIRKLAAQGLRDQDLSAATGWNIDLIRTALGQREQQ